LPDMHPAWRGLRAGTGSTHDSNQVDANPHGYRRPPSVWSFPVIATRRSVWCS
jgi:hypothetical protein